MPIHIAFHSEGAIFLFFLALLNISYSVVIYALVQETGFNLLAASIFHMFINVSNLLFLDVIYEKPFMIVNALIWVVVAIVVVFKKKELFFTGKG